MNKGKIKSSEKNVTNEGNKVGDLFPSASLEEYAAKSRGLNRDLNGHNDIDHSGEEEEEEDDDDGETGEAQDVDKIKDEDECKGEDG